MILRCPFNSPGLIIEVSMLQTSNVVTFQSLMWLVLVAPWRSRLLAARETTFAPISARRDFQGFPSTLHASHPKRLLPTLKTFFHIPAR